MTNKNRIVTILIAAAFVLIGIVVIVSASFAWLNVSRVPFISDLAVSVITDNDLKIAPDENGVPGEWKTYLDVSPYLDLYAPLKPVTYRKSIEDFQKLSFTESGRTKGGEALAPENINSAYPEGSKTGPAAAKAEENGYIVYVDFWLKTEGASADVFLQPPTQTDDGMSNGTYVIGLPVWNQTGKYHQNGGTGSESTLRLGFQSWYSDLSGNLENESEFFVYEPNINLHPGGGNNVTSTQSVDGGLLVAEDHLITQYASTWKDFSPAVEGKVDYTVGQFDTNCTLFKMTGKNMVKVRMWIWMEGQDGDCRALNVREKSSVLANLDFGVNPGEQTTTVVRR